MQSLTQTNMEVNIENYDHMTTKDENVNWMKLTHLLSVFSLDLKAPFCISNFTSKNIITFLDVRTRESIIPLHFVYYVC